MSTIDPTVQVVRAEIQGDGQGPAPFPDIVAGALRLIRTRQGLTQTAASKRPGAPDFRTLSHWETRRKLPSLRILANYLRALGLDFSAFQEALDQIAGVDSAEAALTSRLVELEGLQPRITELERRVSELERPDGES
ncbi:MAG: helix-turn-helix transcriptional regulator [bacterium]|nr:helix-turn-helix transcriptional regulator [bacterium]